MIIKEETIELASFKPNNHIVKVKTWKEKISYQCRPGMHYTGHARSFNVAWTMQTVRLKVILVFTIKQCQEHRPGFHNQNATAPDCLFVSIMTLLSCETGFPSLQQIA